MLAEIASFACMWALLRLALDVKPWFPVATAQLAGNAFSRIVPGGAAAGGAMQFDMLRQAGIGTTWAATGVTAVSLISTATLLGLPVISIVSILITGASVERNLFRVGSIAVVVCLGVMAGGAVLLFADRPLLWVGEVIQKARNRILRRRAPMDGPARPPGRRARPHPPRARHRLVAGAHLQRRQLAARPHGAARRPRGRGRRAARVGRAPRLRGRRLPRHDPHHARAAWGSSRPGLVGTLSLAGIGTDQALLATLVYRLASYWLPIPMGAVAYFLAARKYGRPQHVESDAKGEIAASAALSRLAARRLAPVDQVRDRQHRVAPEHPRPAVAHDLADPLAHRRLVAVRLAVGAGGLLRAVAALLQAEARVVEQLGALGAEPVARVAGRGSSWWSRQ